MAEGRLKIYEGSTWRYAGAGLQGETGVAGTAGGDTGVAGETGAGIQGETGVQGVQGETGIQGETGAGIQGETGVQGIQGQTGVQGTQGETGVAGVAGETGVQGVTGDTGIQGVAGETGVQGVAGETGVQGIQGETGIQGVAGETGVQGIQGDTGVQGIQGVTGVEGSFSKSGTFFNTNGISDGTYNIIAWEAPFDSTVTAVKGYRVGGDGARINARAAGASTHLATDLLVAADHSWVDGGAVQNTDYTSGSKLELMIVDTTGTPTQIAVQVNFDR